MSDTATEARVEDQVAPAKPAAPLEIKWTKEFWDTVSDDQLPEVFRFTPAALADSRQRSGVATARRGKLNPVPRQVQPGRTVLIRVDNVPLMMKIFESADLARAFVDYEEGRIPRFSPSTNTDPKTVRDQPVKWTEIKTDEDVTSATTHEILH